MNDNSNNQINDYSNIKSDNPHSKKISHNNKNMDVASNFSIMSKDDFKTLKVFNVVADLNLARDSMINIIEFLTSLSPNVKFNAFEWLKTHYSNEIESMQDNGKLYRDSLNSLHRFATEILNGIKIVATDFSNIKTSFKALTEENEQQLQHINTLQSKIESMNAS